MKTTFALVISAALMGSAAMAQTTPGSENTTDLAPKPQSHHHRHHTPKPATQSTTAANPATPSSSAAKPSSSSSSTPQSSAAPPTPNPEATVPNPDQGKPGVQNNNTTNMHTPGSENPADNGPTAPKA